MTLSTESINGSDGRMLDRERLGVVYLRKAVSAVDKNADPEFRENVLRVDSGHRPWGMSSRVQNRLIGVDISTEYTDTRIPRSTSTSKLSSRERWPRALVRLHLRCKQHKNRQHEFSPPGLYSEIGG
jgi:hypothetical protein